MFSNNSKHTGFYQSIGKMTIIDINLRKLVLLAQNIHRPLFPIYRKLVRIFDINNYVGK